MIPIWTGAVIAIVTEPTVVQDVPSADILARQDIGGAVDLDPVGRFDNRGRVVIA